MRLYFILICNFFLSGLSAQEEVAILSHRVGTIIDRDENYYYDIFPKENHFINAQVYQVNDNRYKIKISKSIDGEIKMVYRYISLKRFAVLQNKINGKPEMTAAGLKEMYAGLDFLRAEKILNEIPKPQYVNVQHSGNKKLKGTLIHFDKNILHIQTPTTLEKIRLKRVDALSYRKTLNDFEFLRLPVFIFTGVTGFGLAQLFNNNRSIIYNENGIPRKDLNRYSQISGIVIGLIFSSEIFDAVSTLLTPKETLILSKSEFDRKKIKK